MLLGAIVWLAWSALRDDAAAALHP